MALGGLNNAALQQHRELSVTTFQADDMVATVSSTADTIDNTDTTDKTAAGVEGTDTDGLLDTATESQQMSEDWLPDYFSTEKAIIANYNTTSEQEEICSKTNAVQMKQSNVEGKNDHIPYVNKQGSCEMNCVLKETSNFISGPAQSTTRSYKCMQPVLQCTEHQRKPSSTSNRPSLKSGKRPHSNEIDDEITPKRKL